MTNSPLHSVTYLLRPISFIPISCSLLHISIVFILTDYGVYFRWWSCVFFLSRRENYLCGTPRATAHLMLWTRGEFLLAVLLTMASLRLPCPFILYIMGALLLISPISFLLIFEKEIIALNFVSLFLNSVT